MLIMIYKQLFLLLNMSSKLPLKIIYFLIKEMKNIFVEWVWTKKITHYEPYGKTDDKNEHNIREY